MDMNIFPNIYDLSLLEWIIIGLSILFFIIQVTYYLYIFRQPYKYLSKHDDIDEKQLSRNELPGISIIITAKNEADNLLANLPLILEQDYPNYQVVVVNNSSTDSTDDVLNELRSRYPSKLYTTYIPIDSETVNDKKLALTVGIKAAKHDILLFTEADTKPLTNKWVNEYAKEFAKGKDVVLGACQLKVGKGLFKKLIQYSNLMFGIKYLGLALIKRPYMGIERNMAYKKNIFFENKGFSSILNIEYGEDNLFINKIATRNNTSVVISPESMVESNAINQLSTWRTIKGKYLITKKYLKGSGDKVLSFEIVSRYIFYFLFVLMLSIGILQPSKALIWVAIVLFLLRYMLQVIVVNKNSKLFNSGKYFLSLPLFDLLTPILNQQFMNHEKKRNRRL